jgi:dolichyl-phosphate-mannose--protein O-mannosyl transferase
MMPVPDFGPVDRLEGWVVTAVIAALAAVTRTVNLGSPTDAGTPIFDEKHYAPQAWQMLHNHGVEDNPGYGLVVHPPVGKQLIAIGEAIFGYNGLGWRFTGAILGIVMVALVVRIVRRISRSTLVGAIAGLLVVADGVSFVVARTALLDGFLAFFVVAAFGALIVVRAVLCIVSRFDVVGLRRRGAPPVPGAATVAGSHPPRSEPYHLRVAADPIRGVPGQLRAVVRLRDRHRPP